LGEGGEAVWVAVLLDERDRPAEFALANEGGVGIEVTNTVGDVGGIERGDDESEGLALGALMDVGELGLSAGEDEADGGFAEGGEGDVDTVVAGDHRLVRVDIEVRDTTVGTDGTDGEPFGGLLMEILGAAELALNGVGDGSEGGGGEEPVLRQDGKDGEAVALGVLGDLVQGRCRDSVDDDGGGFHRFDGAADGVVIGLAVAGDEYEDGPLLLQRSGIIGRTREGVGFDDGEVRVGLERGEGFGRSSGADALELGEGRGVDRGALRLAGSNEPDRGTSLPEGQGETGGDDRLAIAGKGRADDEGGHTNPPRGVVRAEVYQREI